MCSSQFIRDDWRNNLTAGLTTNLSSYPHKDYRRFLAAHLQFLQGLCRLSRESLSNSTKQFLSSLFITAQLLSEVDFDVRLSSLINQTESIAPIVLNRLLTLIRIVDHGNAIISTYGTNFEYVQNVSDTYDFESVTQAVVYDNNCSCGVAPNCTTQANFIRESVLETAPILGMKMGCTPSESFRLSTLECFYNRSCLSRIQQYTNYPHRIVPLNRTVKRFPVNATVNELINDVFVEKWITSPNYTSYFYKCSPSVCSYTYVERFDHIYTITFLLGLQGGMSIVLKWICPQLVRLAFKLHQHRKKRITPSQVISVVATASTENIHVNVHNRISQMRSDVSACENSEYVSVLVI